MREKGRPTTFTESLAEDICNRIANGQMLGAICEKPGMPNRRTIYRWLEENEEFAKCFRMARRISADALVEQGLDILDEADPSTASLANFRANFRKWLAGKMSPTYSERAALELSGPEQKPIATQLSMDADLGNLAPVLDMIAKIRQARGQEEAGRSNG